MHTQHDAVNAQASLMLVLLAVFFLVKCGVGCLESRVVGGNRMVVCVGVAVLQVVCKRGRVS